MNENHLEISPVILLDQALDNFFWSYDVARRREGHSPLSPHETDHAKIAIILLENSLEGWLNRIVYLLNQQSGELSHLSGLRESADKKLMHLLRIEEPDELIKALDDLLVLRNSLAHSHIYLTERDVHRNIQRVEVRLLRRDPRWRRCVDPETYKTRTRGFNVIPSEVSFCDAKKAFSLWGEIYSALEDSLGENLSRLAPPYPHMYVRSGEHSLSQSEIESCHSPVADLKRFVELCVMPCGH